MGFASAADPLSGPELCRWQVRGLVCLRRVYGLVWLYDAWTASSGATRHALAAFLGLPFASPWVHLAGTGILLLDLYIALALLSGKTLRTALWVGVVYLLVLWLAVERGGDFDPSTGGTDIGLGVPYLLLLIFVCAGQQMVGAAARGGSTATGYFWAGASRVLFGFVWAWDALYKLRPHFLSHFTSYLVGPDAMSGVGAHAMAGMAGMGAQPGWVVAWLHGWVGFINATSPLAFGIATAVIEVVIACGLLTGRWLRVVLPLGLVFSALIWVTAEGFGGPYGNGTTGMPGNMFGTAIIYVFLFAGLMVYHRWPSKRAPAAPRRRH